MFDLKLKKQVDKTEVDDAVNKADESENEQLVISTGSTYKAKEYEALAYLEEEDSASRLVEILEYSKISDCKYEFNEISGLYEVYVSPTSYELANNIYKKVLEDKLLEDVKMAEEENKIEKEEAKELEEEISEEISELNTQKAFKEPTLYDSKEEKYKDNLSSAFTFLFCGVVGLIVVLLNDLGVFKLIQKDSSSFITVNVILILMFAVFCGIGVWSLIYSKKLKLEAKEEKELITKVNEYLEENVFIEDIDKEVDDNIPEEIKFFSRVDFVKNLLNEEFSDYDEELLNQISEKYIEKLYA